MTTSQNDRDKGASPQVSEKAAFGKNEGKMRVSASSRAVGSGSSTGDTLSVLGELETALLKSLREQPGATLALAGAAGFVLGALWRT